MDDPKPELIEQEMACTRSSLVEKIAALEQQVVATVQTATTAVQDTVNTVTSAVHDTTASVRQGLLGVQDGANEAIHGLTDSVKEAFDVTAHVRANPVPMVAGATVAGLLAGLLVFPRTPRLPRDMAAGSEPPRPVAPPPQANPPANPPARPGWLDVLLARAGEEVVKLGEQALSKAVAQARTAIDQNVPRLVDTLVATGVERVGLTADARRF